jgi:hypothetical protein
MGDALRLDGVEALEIEEGLDEARAGWVLLHDGREIGLEGAADRGIGGERAVEGLDDQRQGDDVVLQPRGDAVADGSLERGLVDDGVEEERREGGRLVIALLGLAAEPLPDRVVGFVRLGARHDGKVAMGRAFQCGVSSVSPAVRGPRGRHVTRNPRRSPRDGHA